METTARHQTLMNSAGLGNADAFAEMYDDLSAHTHAICVYHLGNTLEADLAMIDIWVDVWKNANSPVYREGAPANQIMVTADHIAQSRLKVVVDHS